MNNKHLNRVSQVLGFLFFFALLIPATADCAEVTLSWAAPSDDRVVGYYVYWSLNASDFGDPADPGNRPSQRIRIEPADNTSCTISDLEDGQTYYFAATSFDAEGNQSDFSGIIEYTVPLPAADVDDDGDGYTENQGDCNDNNASVHPGAIEICGDGIDQDCNGTDANCPENVDLDGDGYTETEGDCNDSDSSIYPGAIEVCGDGIDQDCSGSDLSCMDADGDGDGFTENQGDCNDNNASVHPGATEICGDNIDQDCSGTDTTCPENVDEDGDGYTEAEGDCNDNDSAIHPGAVDVCGDGIDQDCSGADRSCMDTDGDGDGFTENQGDCNDNNALVHPGASDACGDGIDQDCSGADATCPETIDNDGDGYTETEGDCNDSDSSIYPGAIEVCGDGIDQDCSGSDLSCTDDDNTDSDGDGIADSVERSAPENGDGNLDGTPDDAQCNVVSLQDPDALHFITIEAEPGTQIENCRSVASLDEKMPADAVFEWGVLGFSVTGVPKGGTVRLKIHLPEGAAPTGYQKYGPTPENPTEHWHSFDYNGETGAEINGNVITLHLKDGARGDKLLAADGKIIDPGGPVYMTGASPDDSTDGSSESSSSSFGGCFIQSLNPFH